MGGLPKAGTTGTFPQFDSRVGTSHMIKESFHAVPQGFEALPCIG